MVNRSAAVANHLRRLSKIEKAPPLPGSCEASGAGGYHSYLHLWHRGMVARLHVPGSHRTKRQEVRLNGPTLAEKFKPMLRQAVCAVLPVWNGSHNKQLY